MPSPTAIPTTQTAVIAGPIGDFQIKENHAVPQLEADEVIIKTVAVALNPVDTKLVGDFITQGAIFGFDCAGVVVAVGANVKTGVKAGDRVCGSARGMNKQKPLGGAFAEYVSMPGDLTLKIPEHMSFEQAASLGTAIASACMALFFSMEIPASLEEPTQEPFSVMVYGGSTATGTMVLQMLKLCGAHTIAVCSERNFDLAKSYGADVCFDYHNPSCAEDIREYTKNNLEFAVDCVTEDSTTKFCYKAIGRAGGKYTALNPFSDHLANRKVITPDWILATRVTGDGSDWPVPYGCEADPSLRVTAKEQFVTIQQLLDQGKIKTHPLEISQGGFKDLLEGVNLLRSGKVSGKKLVYTL